MKMAISLVMWMIMSIDGACRQPSVFCRNQAASAQGQKAWLRVLQLLVHRLCSDNSIGTEAAGACGGDASGLGC